jgi:hypothetical protein
VKTKIPRHLQQLNVVDNELYLVNRKHVADFLNVAEFLIFLMEHFILLPSGKYGLGCISRNILPCLIKLQDEAIANVRTEVPRNIDELTNLA